MIVISDASPLINLAVIGELEILQKLFDEVIIPEAVFEEICIKGEGQPGDLEVRQASWIRVEASKNRSMVEKLSQDLDPGEAEAISLAIELASDLLLIDEKLGRTVAKQYHINTVGLLGILLEGKFNGFISNVCDLMNRLKSEANFRIGDDLFEEVRRLAGE
jgi:predicted nucleic acid-binding protein